MAGVLRLCALGYSPERTPTLDVLAALRRCDAVYCERPSPALKRLLGLFCADVRPLPPGPEPLVEEVRRGKSIAWAVFGQPMIFGPRAKDLARRARDAGARVEVLGGLSAFDALLAAAREVFGYGHGWQQVLEDCRPEALAACGPLDPALAAAAFLAQDAPAASWRAVGDKLRAAYGPRARFRLLAEGGARARRGKLAAFPGKPPWRGSAFALVEPHGHAA